MFTWKVCLERKREGYDGRERGRGIQWQREREKEERVTITV